MNEGHIPKIADELNLSIRQVSATRVLLDEGATISFIARYQKEATVAVNEVIIAKICDRQDLL